MKKLLILPLLILLTGCVTYYYPQTALKDGIYYAEDDPSYVVYSGGYAGAAYYPWLSLDYFYLGYYSHGYYSPWYVSHYHFPYYPVRRSYYGYCPDYGGCQRKSKKTRRGGRHDRYARNDHGASGSSSRTRRSENRSNGPRSTPSSSAHRESKNNRIASRRHRD